MIRKLALLMLLSSVVVGCTSPDKVVLREGMYQNVATIRAFAKDCAAKLTVDPATGKDHREDLKSLTPTQYQRLLATDNGFEQLYQEDKARDSSWAK